MLALGVVVSLDKAFGSWGPCTGGVHRATLMFTDSNSEETKANDSNSDQRKPRSKVLSYSIDFRLRNPTIFQKVQLNPTQFGTTGGAACRVPPSIGSVPSSPRQQSRFVSDVHQPCIFFCNSNTPMVGALLYVSSFGVEGILKAVRIEH